MQEVAGRLADMRVFFVIHILKKNIQVPSVFLKVLCNNEVITMYVEAEGVDNNPNIFTARFNEELKRSGLTKAEVSREIDVSKSTISRYSDGSILPNADTLANICLLFKCSADYLLGLNQLRNLDSIKDDHSNLYLNFDISNLAPQKIEEIKTFIEYQISRTKKENTL